MIGRLRHRLVVQAENPLPDGGGGRGDPWAAPITLATVWGRVEPLGGAERLRAMQLDARVSHRVTLRYRADVTARERLVFGQRVFKIRAVINLEERNEWLQLLCEEGIGA